MSKQPAAKPRRAATPDPRRDSPKAEKPGSKAAEPAPAIDLESAHQRAS